MNCVITRVSFVVLFSTVILIVNVQAQTSVIVPATPLWTDTGIVLSSGDQVTITASGSWSWSGFPFVGPEGGPAPPLHYDEFEHFDDNDHGRLIGFIGPDPYQGHSGGGSFFPQPSGYISVGAGTTFTASTGGKLWLGFNDDAYSGATYDNVGSVTAVISVAGVCNPPTTIFWDPQGATGLADAIVSNPHLDQGKRLAEAEVENFTSLWLGVRRIRSTSNLNSLAPDLSKVVLGRLARAEVIPPCQSGPFQRCKSPGKAAWIGSFCSPGILRIDLELTELSNIAMLTDALIGALPKTKVPVPGDISSILSLATELQTIPAIAEAGACLSGVGDSNQRGRGAVDKAVCASRALSKIVTDREQRLQLLAILSDFGIDLTFDEVVNFVTKL